MLGTVIDNLNITLRVHSKFINKFQVKCIHHKFKSIQVNYSNKQPLIKLIFFGEIIHYTTKFHRKNKCMCNIRNMQNQTKLESSKILSISFLMN